MELPLKPINLLTCPFGGLASSIGRVDVVRRRSLLKAYQRVDMLALGVVDARNQPWESPRSLYGPIRVGDLLGVPRYIVSPTEAGRRLVAGVALRPCYPFSSRH